MPRSHNVSGSRTHSVPNLGDLLTARPSGLSEPESWAILCQAVQALQDLFLSDGASGGVCIPLITPTTLLLSSRGRVRLYQSPLSIGCGPSPHLTGYLAPEYRPGKQCSDTEMEKMWIYGLGETLKRATLTTHAATSRLSGELCQVLTDMTKASTSSRASLMHLLDVISEYCKKRQQNRPFSHIVMDLHQEAMAALELALDTPWGPPAMPELRSVARNRCDSIPADINMLSNMMPKRWMGLMRTPEKQKLTREASTSMEDLSNKIPTTPSNRPKSMCIPDGPDIYHEIDEHTKYYNERDDYIRLDNNKYYEVNRIDNVNVNLSDANKLYGANVMLGQGYSQIGQSPNQLVRQSPTGQNLVMHSQVGPNLVTHSQNLVTAGQNVAMQNQMGQKFQKELSQTSLSPGRHTDHKTSKKTSIPNFPDKTSHIPRFGRVKHQDSKDPKQKNRRNPVQRAASRLYRAGIDNPIYETSSGQIRDTVGPEFVVRAALPRKEIIMTDNKSSGKKTVTVIMLNGQKIDVICNPNTTTAGQLFEIIIQKEHIEENFMLGLSALIAGDFIFLPSDTRICKAMVPSNLPGAALTLFLRVRFFLPTLRGIRGLQTRHLLYLQLRRSILEHQLPCSFSQLVELDGLALQAEFGDYNKREHGTRDYFLLEHYVPETMTCAIGDVNNLKNELIKMHQAKNGLDQEKAEEEFIILSQSLPHYGGHFYTATWVLKDNNTQKDVWLYISSQGINLYERGNTTSTCGPLLLEMFEWRTIQTLCYSKHYLCVLPHSAKLHGSKLKKYKLKMDHKKSYFTFRLASLHHQFFLRLRTEFTSLQMLSQQFGIPLKDMKNETNSLYKLEALTNPLYMQLDKATVNAETEFKIEFRFSSKSRNRGSNKNGKDSKENNKNASNSRENNKGSNNDRHSKDYNKFKRSKSTSDFTMVKEESVNEDYQNKENENPYHYKIPMQKNHHRSGLVLDSSCLSGLPSTGDKRRGVKMGIRAISNAGHRVSRSMEAVNTLTSEELEQLSLQSVSLHCSSASIASPVTEYKGMGDAYILDSTIKSCSNQFLPDLQETLSQSFLEKLNKFSFAEERILTTVTLEKDSKGSLGMQIMEGCNGKVYVQSVIPGGPAYNTCRICTGDQIMSVNGQNLLSLKYEDALQILKNTGNVVEFILSQVSNSNIHTQSTLKLVEPEKTLRSRLDLSDINESHLQCVNLDRTLSKLQVPAQFSFNENINAQLSNIKLPLSKTNSQLSNNGLQLSNNTSQLSNNASQLSNNALHLSNNALQLSNNALQLSNNVLQLSNNALYLSHNASQLSNNNSQFSNNIQQLSNNIPQLSNNIPQLSNNIPQLSNTYLQLSNVNIPLFDNCNFKEFDSNVEKHVTESCRDLSNLQKYANFTSNIKSSSNLLISPTYSNSNSILFNSQNNLMHSNSNVSNALKLSVDVPYHKHIRYEIESESENIMTKKQLVDLSPQMQISENSFKNRSLNKNISKSCNQIYFGSEDRNKAVVVDMIPKGGSAVNILENFRSLDRRLVKKSSWKDCDLGHLGNEVDCNEDDNLKKNNNIPPIALPRSLGLSRKWRGPVRYPVTPVKKSGITEDTENYTTTSDDEQVFI